MKKTSPIVIADYECSSPLGLTFSETWKRLTACESGINNLDRFTPYEHPLMSVSNVTYAGQIPATYEELSGSAARFKRWPDPSSEILRSVCNRLLTRLNYKKVEHTSYRFAVIGATALTATLGHDAVVNTGRPVFNGLLTRCQNIPLSIVATDWGLQGPQFCVGGACASGGHAMLIASDLLKAGTIDAALICGFELPLQPINTGGFAWLNAAYKNENTDDRATQDPSKASRPFSFDRKGIILSEGVAALVLTREDYATEHNWPIAGTLLGGAMNSDAEGFTALKRESVAYCMRQALQQAKVSPDDIQCINAHATSTPQGDKIELEALSDVFENKLATIPIVANKSQIGHTLGASSLFGVIFALHGMKTDTLLPTLNYLPDETLPTACITPDLQKKAHGLTIANSFGFGGTNACLVLSRSPHYSVQ